MFFLRSGFLIFFSNMVITGRCFSFVLGRDLRVMHEQGGLEMEWTPAYGTRLLAYPCSGRDNTIGIIE